MMEEKELNAILDKVKDQVGDLTKGYASKEDQEKAVEEINSNIAKLNEMPGKLEELEKALETQGIEMQKLNKSEKSYTFKGIINDAFNKEGVAEQIQKVHSAGAGVTKVVGTVSTASVTTDTGGNAILDMINADDIEGMRLRVPWIEQYANVTRTSKPVYTYVDYVPKEGGATHVAEGALKPELDLSAVVRTITPVKARPARPHLPKSASRNQSAGPWTQKSRPIPCRR